VSKLPAETKWVWIGIFKSAEPHSPRDACYSSYLKASGVSVEHKSLISYVHHRQWTVLYSRKHVSLVYLIYYIRSTKICAGVVARDGTSGWRWRTCDDGEWRRQTFTMCCDCWRSAVQRHRYCDRRAMSVSPPPSIHNLDNR